MSPRSYCMVSAAVFFAIAAAHLVRALIQLPFEVGGVVLPGWVSWASAAAAAGLSAWGFRSAGR